MDSLNVIAITGTLERDPLMRFDTDTAAAKCAATLRCEDCLAVLERLRTMAGRAGVRDLHDDNGREARGMPDEYRVTIRLSPDLYAQLEARGSHGQPLAAIVRDALIDYLARQPEQPPSHAETATTLVALLLARLTILAPGLMRWWRGRPTIGTQMLLAPRPILLLIQRQG
jgi:hypothetical protein